MNQPLEPRSRAPFAPRLDEDDDEGDTAVQAPKAGPAFLDKYLLEARVLMVTGPVSDRMAQSVATRALVLEQLDPQRPITVMINSPGGSADSGFAIYDVLRFVSPPIVTVVNGLCASAAILIGLAAEKNRRFTMPGSRFLIHQPSTGAQGSASDLDITAREILKMRERYNRIIAERTGQDAEKVLEDARRDFWLSAEESVKYGLVAKIVRKRSEIPG